MKNLKKLASVNNVFFNCKSFTYKNSQKQRYQGLNKTTCNNLSIPIYSNGTLTFAYASSLVDCLGTNTSLLIMDSYSYSENGEEFSCSSSDSSVKKLTDSKNYRKYLAECVGELNGLLDFDKEGGKNCSFYNPSIFSPSKPCMNACKTLLSQQKGDIIYSGSNFDYAILMDLFQSEELKKGVSSFKIFLERI